MLRLAVRVECWVRQVRLAAVQASTTKSFNPLLPFPVFLLVPLPPGSLRLLRILRILGRVLCVLLTLHLIIILLNIQPMGSKCCVPHSPVAYESTLKPTLTYISAKEVDISNNTSLTDSPNK